ncbi:MAG: NADH-quinone oxidoreductase subunit NuoH [Chloroflexi bacterium]|nr:NADH-quinone oxidoreductase subunit NuoH [Chloroflexota bacterium]
MLVFLVLVLLTVMYIERKLIGRFQVRFGPNRVGPVGLLQPVADAIKVLTKEDFVPACVDKPVFRLAPIAAFIPALLPFAVIPFAPRTIYTDLNIGMLYLVAVMSLGTIAVFMAGWASNNKFSLLGAMRAIAQAVSYEIPMVLALVGVAMVAGSLQMTAIVKAQSVPFILMQPLGFVIYFIGALSEINRSPFDIMEAESEIVAGYHTEYSGMSFSLFYLAEYTHAIAVGGITATLFLSGWEGPLLPSWLWFLIKVYAVFAVLVWFRATLPRLRVDQLMGFAWKFLLPLALVNILVIGIELSIWPDFPWALLFVNVGIAALALTAWSKVYQARGALA